MIDIYLFPFVLLLLFIYALFKKIPLYSSFIEGAKQALKMVVKTFPYLFAMFILVELMRASSIIAWISKIASPLFNALGVPPEVTELVLFLPLSGNGSIAILKEIYTNFGTDSYISICASVIMGCSDTVFYISSVYFSSTSVKKLGYTIPLSLFICFIGAVIGCFITRLIYHF